MTRARGIFRRRRQAADSAGHVKLCNPFLPDGDPNGRELTSCRKVPDHGTQTARLATTLSTIPARPSQNP